MYLTPWNCCRVPGHHGLALSLTVHQILESLLEHKLLGQQPNIRVFDDPVGLEWDLVIGISEKFPGYATAILGTTL